MKEMQEAIKQKMTIRLGKGTLSFTKQDPADRERPVSYEPYTVKGGISMAANLREALSGGTAIRRAQVLADTPSLLVPVEQFEETNMVKLFNYSYPPGAEEQRTVLYNVLPDLKAVCLFAVNKDVQTVLGDRFDEVKYIQAMTPVWHYLHHRSYTGHRSKLYGYFHEGRLDLFGFQQARFKYCNAFDAAHAHDALYFLLYVWKQLRLEAEHDELHLVGDIPEQEWLLGELKQYLQKAYVINPAADFGTLQGVTDSHMPFDLMTLIVKGR